MQCFLGTTLYIFYVGAVLFLPVWSHHDSIIVEHSLRGKSEILMQILYWNQIHKHLHDFTTCYCIRLF